MMPRLTNIREQTVHGIPMVIADFKIADGRMGSVSVERELYQLHGEVLLQQEAEGVEAQARHHRYQPPQHERFRELG